MDMTAVLREIESWPVDDRIHFVEQVWDRILDTGWQPELTDDQKVELDRRIEALDADPNNVLSWEAVEKHVRRKR